MTETERLTKSIRDEIVTDLLEEETEKEDPAVIDIKNPFVHKVEWNDPIDKIRVSFFFYSCKFFFFQNNKLLIQMYRTMYSTFCRHRLFSMEPPIFAQHILCMNHRGGFL